MRSECVVEVVICAFTLFIENMIPLFPSIEAVLSSCFHVVGHPDMPLLLSVTALCKGYALVMLDLGKGDFPPVQNFSDNPPLRAFRDGSQLLLLFCKPRKAWAECQ